MCVVIDRARAAAAKDYLSVLPAEDRAELDRLLRLLLEVHD